MTEVGFRDELRPAGVEERPLGYWGMLLALAVLATTYVALFFSYVYIRIGTVDWPPAGIEPPPLGRATLSALLLLASTAPVLWASRREAAGGIVGLRVGLAAGVVLAGLHLGLLQVDLLEAPFGVADHAYGSLFYVLPGIHATVLGLALVMALVLLAMSVKGHVGPERHIGMRSLRAFWYVTVGGGVGTIAVVYLVPHVWPTAQVGS